MGCDTWLVAVEPVPVILAIWPTMSWPAAPPVQLPRVAVTLTVSSIVPAPLSLGMCPLIVTMIGGLPCLYVPRLAHVTVELPETTPPLDAPVMVQLGDPLRVLTVSTAWMLTRSQAM